MHGSGHGKVTTDVVLDPLKHYDVYTSSVAGDPPKPSGSLMSNDYRAVRQAGGLAAKEKVLAFLSGAVAFVRGDRRSLAERASSGAARSVRSAVAGQRAVRRSASTASRTKQPATCSLTMPVACMSA